MSDSIHLKKLLIKAKKTLEQTQQKLVAAESRIHAPLAIVGAGLRLPGGVSDIDGLWDLLAHGVDTLVEIPEARMNIAPFYDADPEKKGHTYTKHASMLDDVAGFDASFFGISPNEARCMDPQHRLLLEASWTALEDAGIDPKSLKGTNTGVFVGTEPSGYTPRSGLEPSDDPSAYIVTGSLDSFAAGRIAYHLGLKGPSMITDTACSSSLVALHLAAQHIRSGACDIALVGAFKVLVDPSAFVMLSQTQALSADGRCKTFSEAADGYGRGEGGGVVVMMPLDRAQAEGRRVLGVLRGTAVNHDGESSGITAPNGTSQQIVLKSALKNAQWKPADVDYVECHGTGTSLGDPIEIQALDAVYGASRSKDEPLLIGAVKTNVGHLESASGMASLFKVLASFRHNALPPTLHSNPRNPHLNWENLRLSVIDEIHAWPKKTDKPRRVGISAFGLSGTNAHVLLEDAPSREQEAKKPVLADVPLVLSAKTDASLQAQASRWADWLEKNPEVSVGDALKTAIYERSHFRYRAAAYGGEADLIKGLRLIADGVASSRRHSLGRSRKNPKVAMLFTGQGAQFSGMGRELYGMPGLEIFTEALDATLEACASHLSKNLRDIIWDPDHSGLLSQTRYTQPALFALETALFRQCEAWGFSPEILLGHSIGELTAAHVAGVFDLEAAAALVCARGRLMDELAIAGGQMASLDATSDEIGLALDSLPQSLKAKVSIAAENSSSQTVVSGDADAVNALVELFKAEGRRTRNLTVSHAFHSHHMDAVLEAFREIAEGVSYQTPTLKIVSNVTGFLAKPEQGDLVTADYWVRQLRGAVHFRDCVDTAMKEEVSAFLECGPTGVLCGLVSDCLTDDVDVPLIPVLRKGTPDLEAIASAVGELFVCGISEPIENMLPSSPGIGAALPTYAFRRKRYWNEGLTKFNEQPDASELLQMLSATDQNELFEAVDASSEEIAVLNRLLPRLSQCRDNSASVQSVSLEKVQDIEPEKTLVKSKAMNTHGLDVLNMLTEAVARKLGIEDLSEIEPDISFLELGLDSLSGVELEKELKQTLGIEMPKDLLFTYPTLASFAGWLEEQLDEGQEANELTESAPASDVQEILELSGEQRLAAMILLTKKKVAARLGIEDLDEIDDDISFLELGIDSLVGTELQKDLRKETGLELPKSMLFEYPRVDAFAGLLLELLEAKNGKDLVVLAQAEDIPASVPTDDSEMLQVDKEAHRDAADDQALERSPRLESNPGLVEIARGPVSPEQEQLYFLHQILDEKELYNFHVILRIRQPLDPQTLREAMSTVAKRHEQLRTAIVFDGGAPIQRVFDDAPLALEVQDLRQSAESEKEILRQAMIDEFVIQPFELSKPPLFRLLMLQDTAQETVLVAMWHHIVADGWAAGVYMQELFQCYEAIQKSSTVSLPEPTSFLAYASERQDWRKSPESQPSRVFWTKHLKDYSCLTLPYDFRRTDETSYEGAVERFTISSALHDSLKDVCRRVPCTPFIALLGAWAMTLGRISGQEDVLLGTLFSGHDDSAHDRTLGYFSRTVPVRCNVQATTTKKMLLRLQKRMNAVRSHQVLPYRDILACAGGAKADRRNIDPLLDAVFVLEDGRTLSADDSVDLETPSLSGDVASTSKYPIAMALMPTNEGMDASINYMTDLFASETIKRMAARFTHVLECMVGDIEDEVGSVISSSERETLLQHFQGTSPTTWTPPTIPGCFATIARQFPQRDALIFGARRLTYQELDEQSDRLAWALLQSGVQRGDPVGAFLERSIEAVVAWLGIMKAGAAYVPLDPNLPEDRVQMILEDGDIQRVVTLSDKHKASWFLNVKTFEPLLGLDPDFERPKLELSADDLAYIIYTSGSTGRPKGVLVTHGPLVRLTNWTIDTYQLNETSRLGLYGSVGFDAHSWNIWITLLCGASLHIIADEVRGDLRETWRWFMEQRIEGVFLPTPVINTLIGAGLKADEGTKLKIFAGGDTLTAYPAPDAGFELYNHYGPTEATVLVSQCQVTAGDSGTPPIGKPIHYTQLHVVDENMDLQPIGVPGELMIAGEQLAKGYLNDVENTEAKFIPNPFGGAGSRMYRTGDLCRWRYDGQLEFLGRLDTQVKIRGYRVELGEIESALTRQAEIMHAVVTVNTQIAPTPKLVAYLVLRAGQVLEGDELAQRLMRILPDYMVPSLWVLLDSIPRTANGKIDRQALPAPEPETLFDSDESYSSPESVTERKVATIFARALGISKERLSVLDNFFELGGDSLMILTVLSELEQYSGKPFTFPMFLDGPTVRGVSELVDGKRYVDASPALVPLKRSGHQSPLFIVTSGHQDMIAWNKVARAMRGDTPVYGLQVPIESEGLGFENLAELCDIYIDAIRRVQPEGPYRIMGFSVGGVVTHQLAERMQKTGMPLSFVGLLDPISTQTRRSKLNKKMLSMGIRASASRAGRRFVGAHDFIAKAPVLRDIDVNEKLRLLLQFVSDDLGFQQNLELINNHNMQFYSGNVVLFLPRQLPFSPVYNFRSITKDNGDWGSLCEKVSVEVLEGDHFSMQFGDNVPRFVLGLRKYL